MDNLKSLKSILTAALNVPVRPAGEDSPFSYHTFTSSAYGFSQDIDNHIDNVLSKIERNIMNLESFKDFQRIMREVTKPNKLLILSECWNDLLELYSQKDLQDLLINVYQVTEFPNMDMDVSVDRLLYMFDCLDMRSWGDEEIVVYRGFQTPVGLEPYYDAMSWSLTYDAALWFATRFVKEDYVSTVYRAKVSLRDVFYRCDDDSNKEQEVIVDPYGLKDIVVYNKPKKKLLIASNNIGKLKEFKEILSDFEVYSLKDVGIDLDVEETGLTYEENAILKVQPLMDQFDYVVADDSGIEINGLGGNPGIYSARFLGDTSYDYKIDFILKRLENYNDRRARLTSVIALSDHGKIQTFHGILDGLIHTEPLGENGFGYDSIFYLPELGSTVAQIEVEKKNKISHRAKSLYMLRDYLNKLD